MVKVKNDDYGAARLLLLRDGGGRKAWADLLEVDENPDVSRLLGEAAQHSVRHGAQADRLARKNIPFSDRWPLPATPRTPHGVRQG